MSLVVTPGQLAKRAELYYQFSQLINAGISLPQAVQSQLRNPPSAADRQPLAYLHAQLQEGHTLSDSLMRLGNWMPSFDVALLSAGEKSGRLPACFKLLANYYQERARLARQVIGDLIYPFFLFHFAFLLLPLAFFWPPPNILELEQVIAYLLKVLMFIAPVYVFLGVLIFAAIGGRGEKWRETVESISYSVPLLGRARKSLALARLTAALGALLNAGVPIIDSWELAAAACGSRRYRRLVSGWRDSLETGSTPAELVVASGEFPELFANLYHSGEYSGKLDDELEHLNSYYHEEGTRLLQGASKLATRLVYFGMVLLVAFVVFRFYLNYFSGVLGGL